MEVVIFGNELVIGFVAVFGSFIIWRIWSRIKVRPRDHKQALWRTDEYGKTRPK